jgi:beta-glucanase (GH16 family)
MSATAESAVVEGGSSPDVTPVGVPGRWRLVFRDEFHGTRLDLDKWRPNWLAGSDREITKPVNRAELAAYDPRQVRVAKGSLRLRAVKRDTKDNQGRRYRYASGLVESYHDYQFRYGYAEARIFLKANKDPSLGDVGSCGPNWPAFWLNGEDHPEDGEIDVMECLSDDDVAWHYHWGGGSKGGYPDSWSGSMPGGGGWHTFGVDWQRGRLTFYYDGRKVGSHTRGVTGSPHYLVLNNAISGTERRVPAKLKVDYVRVWKTSG